MVWQICYGIWNWTASFYRIYSDRDVKIFVGVCLDILCLKHPWMLSVNDHERSV